MVLHYIPLPRKDKTPGKKKKTKQKKTLEKTASRTTLQDTQKYESILTCLFKGQREIYSY